MACAKRRRSRRAATIHEIRCTRRRRAIRRRDRQSAPPAPQKIARGHRMGCQRWCERGENRFLSLREKFRSARDALRDFPENAGAEPVPAPYLGHAGYEVVAHVVGVARGLGAVRRGSADDLEMLSARDSPKLGPKQLVHGCAVVSRRPITAGAFGRGHRGHGALARRLAAAWATARRRTGVPHCKQREPPGVHRGPARRPPGLAGGPRVHGAHGEAPPRPCDARAPERAMLLVTKRL